MGDNLGQKVVYSDVGMIFLGEIIEYFYQKPVQEVITKEVLEPLAMFDSTFKPDKKRCVPTEVIEKTVIKGRVHDPKAFILKENCGSAGLFSTLNDLVKFSTWLLFDVAKKGDVLQAKTIENLFKDHTSNSQKRSLGWDLRYNKEKQACLYHTGFTGTFMVLDKHQQKGLIVLTNRIHPTSDNQIFLDKREKIVNTFLYE